MSTTSSRSIKLGFTSNTQGIEYSQEFAAADFAPSPADNREISLVAGNNTIDIPLSAVGITIVPPSDNDETITLKGENADTGIVLSSTDPTSLGVDTIDHIVLNVTDDVDVRIIIS